MIFKTQFSKIFCSLLIAESSIYGQNAFNDNDNEVNGIVRAIIGPVEQDNNQRFNNENAENLLMNRFNQLHNLMREFMALPGANAFLARQGIAQQNNEQIGNIAGGAINQPNNPNLEFIRNNGNDLNWNNFAADNNPNNQGNRRFIQAL